MVKFGPIAGYVPPADIIGDVCGPPYDVINSEEARAYVADKPHSIVHVNKPEVDLPEGVSLYSDEVYEMGKTNLERWIEEGLLVQSDTPIYYIYAQQMGERIQYGIVGGASVEDYGAGIIKLHEKTRQDKEDDRTRMIQTQDANVGPVFLTYKAHPEIDTLVASHATETPDREWVDYLDVVHRMWFVANPEEVATLQRCFGEIDYSYVADGHHRARSAWRVGQMKGESDASFLAVMFPDEQLFIMDYNRVIKSLPEGMTHDEMMTQLHERFDLTPVDDADAAKPQGQREFAFYHAGTWYTMVPKPGVLAEVAAAAEEDCIEGLDTQVLTRHCLTPLFGIEDLRTAKTIDFVGGIRGYAELARRVDEGCVCAFALFPVTIAELMMVADNNKLMPPKSTWFEPKLASGACILKY